MELADIKAGDRITFKAAVRSGCRKATRVVTSVPGEMPWPAMFTVKSYEGWSNFAVSPGEIISHHPRGTT